MELAAWQQVCRGQFVSWVGQILKETWGGASQSNWANAASELALWGVGSTQARCRLPRSGSTKEQWWLFLQPSLWHAVPSHMWFEPSELLTLCWSLG